MSDELYPPVEGEEGKEEPKKKKKKVKFVDAADKKIRVILLKRSGKKMASEIIGLELYGVVLADCARLMSKKFACGAAATLIEYKEVSQEGISVQGNVREGFEGFCANELGKYKINFELVSFEEGGNKKGRTQ